MPAKKYSKISKNKKAGGKPASIYQMNVLLFFLKKLEKLVELRLYHNACTTIGCFSLG